MVTCTVGVHRGRVFYCEELSWRVGVFKDRWHAGEILASFLERLISEGLVEKPDVVFAVPAGGVPVAIQVWKRLGGELDLIVVKKVTFPWTTEAGFGAIGPDGVPLVDRMVVRELGEDVVQEQVEKAWSKVRERLVRLRGTSVYKRLDKLKVIIIDDGIAAGWTMAVASRFARRLGASSVYAAAPTASLDGAELVAKFADKVITVNLRGGPYFAVADAYLEWRDLEDEEVLEMLRKAVWKPPTTR